MQGAASYMRPEGGGMEEEVWNSHWKFRGRHWISSERLVVDVNETGGAGLRGEGPQRGDAPWDHYYALRRGERGRWARARRGYCECVEVENTQLPLWVVNPGSGRPSRSRTAPGNVQNAMSSRQAGCAPDCLVLWGWIWDLGPVLLCVASVAGAVRAVKRRER